MKHRSTKIRHRPRKVSKGETLSPIHKFPTHPIQHELLKTIATARDEAKGASSRAKKVELDMQSVIDEADHTIPLVPYIKPRDVEGLLNIWTSAAQLASRVNTELESYEGDTGGTVSLSSTSTAMISGAFVHDGLLVDASGFEAVWQPYAEFANRPAIKAEVAALLSDYGLDKPQFPGDKSPLEQFEIAHKAYESPLTNTNPVATSLIPLRECIQSVIDGLISGRPVQEKAQSQRDKILSIGRQLGSDSLPADFFGDLADEWQDLNKGSLSQSKRKEAQRAEWLNQLNRGTAFLRSLLKGLDRSKFRR
jgi:hypothetical protein